MMNIFEKSGFILQGNENKDLEIYQKGNVILLAMKKFKDNKKAFRQSSNHLDAGLIAELKEEFNSLSSRDDIQSVILTSAHKVVFSRGAKVEIMLNATREECRQFIGKLQELILQIQRFLKPVIAAINGLTWGGGLELAMACDYRISSDRENVVFGMPEASVGIIPGMGGTQNLSRLIGREKSFEIIANAKIDIDPVKAKSYSLVDMVTPADELITKSFAFAKRKDLKKTFDGASGQPTVEQSVIEEEIKNFLANKKVEVVPDMRSAPLAKALISLIFEKDSSLNYLDGLKYEQEIIVYLQGTADCKEGITALIEERKPVFCGK
ncbi:MAG: enoyl-CoA hydratase/isomerase family protein [Desulfobacterales bacterium]